MTTTMPMFKTTVQSIYNSKFTEKQILPSFKRQINHLFVALALVY